MQEYKYYIAGEFKSSKEGIPADNPATEEVFARIFETSRQDFDAALKEAKQAYKEWKEVSFGQRAKILREISKAITDNLSELAELESKEIGKPLKESLFVDVPLGAQCFDYYASFLDSLQQPMIEGNFGVDYLGYEPYGVCGVYLPYNVPLMIFGFSCAGALAAGNSLIIKPSEYGSLSILKLIQRIDALDIPKGLINVVTGSGQAVGSYLAESGLDLISFTGSRQTLQKVIVSSANQPKKVICELGGCNLTAVLSDCDKPEAVQNILGSSFMKQGQMCIGTSIVLVEEGIYDEVVDAVVTKAGDIKVGDPFSADTGLGALPTREHLNRVHSRVKDLEKRGNRILCGARLYKGQGYFYPPTVIEIDKILYEEFFAPIILIKRCRLDEIKEIIEGNPTGLVLQLWTKDIDKARHLAKKARCGTVWINTFAQMSPQTPFGGMGQSGWGRNLGRFGFFEYVQPKHIGIGFKKSPVSGWFGV